MLPVTLALTLTGCQTLGPSAEQIKEMKGTSSSFCVEAGPSLYNAAISAHYASFGGQSVGTAGGGGTANCGKSSVTFNNEGRLNPGAVTVTTTPATTTTTTTTPIK